MSRNDPVAYKNARHLPWSEASAPFIFLKAQAGEESTLSMAVLTQKLLLHADRCLQHEDVVKKILLAGSNRTLDELLCDSFAKLIEDMEVGKWDDATGDFWSRLAKALQQFNISVTWAEPVGQQTRISANHWKNGLGCSN